MASNDLLTHVYDINLLEASQSQIFEDFTAQSSSSTVFVSPRNSVWVDQAYITLELMLARIYQDPSMCHIQNFDVLQGSNCHISRHERVCIDERSPSVQELVQILPKSYIVSSHRR